MTNHKHAHDGNRVYRMNIGSASPLIGREAPCVSKFPVFQKFLPVVPGTFTFDHYLSYNSALSPFLPTRAPSLPPSVPFLAQTTINMHVVTLAAVSSAYSFFGRLEGDRLVAEWKKDHQYVNALACSSSSFYSAVLFEDTAYAGVQHWIDGSAGECRGLSGANVGSSQFVTQAGGSTPICDAAANEITLLYYDGYGCSGNVVASITGNQPSLHNLQPLSVRFTCSGVAPSPCAATAPSLVIQKK